VKSAWSIASTGIERTTGTASRRDAIHRPACDAWFCRELVGEDLPAASSTWARLWKLVRARRASPCPGERTTPAWPSMQQHQLGGSDAPPLLLIQLRRAA